MTQTLPINNIIAAYLQVNLVISDGEFNTIYPLSIQKFGRRHWTPISVARKAADFLVTSPETRVLDIGAGVGKFCMLGAAYTKGVFTGIEQRENLVTIARSVINTYEVPRVQILHANITQIDFSKYDAFYFYNSFYENIDSEGVIDDKLELSDALFKYYTAYLYRQLNDAPVGTRLATYWTQGEQIPDSYKLEMSDSFGLLKLWIKS